MKNLWLSLTLLFIAPFTQAQIWPSGLSGRWTFDNTSNLVEATTGNALTLTGTAIPVNGPVAGDGAVAVDVGSYFSCTHGIAANGGGTLVNEYSLMFDLMITNPNQYHSIFQTNVSNSNDGDCFVNTNSQIGLSNTGYSGFAMKARKWYRIVICVDNGSSYRIYSDGHQILEGTNQSVDGRFSLDPSLLFFADENGEDQLIYCAQIAVFNRCLNAAEVHGLGGLQYSDIQPYLQSPVEGGIVVSWNSWESTGTSVEYGLTPALGSSAAGSYTDISPLRWHNVKLAGLNPDTRYYYRCISGTDTSAVYHFRTTTAAANPAKHLRFLKAGDSQANSEDVSRRIADTMVYQMKNLFGNDWMDSVAFVMHSGDINQDGIDVNRYMNEFFNSYSSISCYIPIMISIGNHEGESFAFYQLVDYSNLTGFSERYYTFNLGKCQFIALNTSGTYNNIIQSNWLQTQLNLSATDASIDYIFAFNHQPGHSELWPDGNSSWVESTIYPLYKQYPKMIMSTCGHSHNYERATLLSTHSSNWDFRSVLSGGAGGGLDRWGMYTNQNDYNDIQKTIDDYNFCFVDVNQADRRVEFTAYSLGNSDKPKNLEVIDHWHRYLNQAAPEKPVAYQPDTVVNITPVLIASPFSGSDSLMSSEFQLAAISGSFSTPLLDNTRDVEDLYQNSGSPYFIPINVNASFDLRRLQVPAGLLTDGGTYMWRMRYRDQNVRWSDWSDTLNFTVDISSGNQCDFVADQTSGIVPFTVQFTDLSYNNADSWSWDLDGDGNEDATVQDPSFTYTNPGIYTVSLTAGFGAQQLSRTRSYYINAMTLSVDELAKDSGFELAPNPATDGLEFYFSNSGQSCCIEIYNLQGCLVKTLFSGSISSGNHRIYWDLCDNDGKTCSPGVYVCRFLSQGNTLCRKLVITK
jgi:PKD repeat protein